MHWADAPSGLPRLLLSPQGAGARDAKGGKRPSPAPTRRRAPQRGSRTLPRRGGSGRVGSGRVLPSPAPLPAARETTPESPLPPRAAPTSPMARHRPTSHLHHRSRTAAMLPPRHRHPQRRTARRVIARRRGGPFPPHHGSGSLREPPRKASREAGAGSAAPGGPPPPPTLSNESH